MMLYILYLIVLGGILVAGNKNIYTLFILMFILLLFGLNNHHLGYSSYYNMDFSNYYSLYNSQYEQLKVRNVEFGFFFLIKFCKFIGLNFTEFRLFVGCLGYSLLLFVIQKFSYNKNYVLLLYLIFPFINDVIQIRNFLAMSVIVFSISLLINGGKYRLLLYPLGIAVACSIHKGSFFFFIVIVLNVFSIEVLAKIIVIILPPLVALCFTTFYRNFIQLITDDPKILFYFSRQTTFGLIVVFGILFLFFFSFYVSYKECVSRKRSEFDIEKEHFARQARFYKIMLKINLIMLLIAPLIVHDLNYIRIYRNILPLNYIIMVDAISQSNKNRKIIYIYGLSIFLGVMFIFFYASHYTEQIFPVFNDNYILKKF